MTKDEALSLEQTLRLALEALETCNWFDDGEYGHAEYDHVSTNKAITAIKAALLSRSDGEAQTRSVVKDEPVAWISPTELLVMRGNALGGAKDWRVNVGLKPEDGDVGLYTTTPQRKPLTQQQINQMMADAGWQNSAIRQADLDKVKKVARAIEAAHGIKGEA